MRPRCYAGGVQKVVQKFHAFAEAEQADRQYYHSLTPERRMEILWTMVEQVRAASNETAQGFSRVYRIVKRAAPHRTSEPPPGNKTAPM
jgi:hypothetical protein